MSDTVSFLDGVNILDGMPSRQAGTILFAIEGRTAQLVSLSRQALASYQTEKTVAEKEQAFLAAIAQGRELPLHPTIRDIERFAPEWASLVPSDDRQRAALARKLGEKYRFRSQDVPALRKALGLKAAGVAQAFERLFQQPIESIYAASIPLSEKIRWSASRVAGSLERMSPLWTAFALTLTETVGASVLALPIALAGVGPMPGLLLLLTLGLVNILTILGMVEAITRNGNMRYGTAYFGRLVGDYLGKPGSITLIPALLLLNITTLLAFYVGIATSLADITGITPLLWPALAFLVAVYFLRRETLSATVASALVIGMINIAILLILSVLALSHVQSANLQYASSRMGGAQLFDPGMLELIFGVILFAYFGHTSAGNAAKVVLLRDPGGRSLVWGNVMAMATAIALYSLWVFAVSGAIPAIELARETGTALSPLASRIGGIVPTLGIIYIALAMGMGTVHMSYGLYYQVREALPAKVKTTTQFLAGLVPTALVFVVVEWMLLAGRESFSGLLGVFGVLLLPLLGGILPIMMLVASRRKGDYTPQLSFDFLGNPLVVAMVYLIYLGSLFAYGLFIWDDPFQRFMAMGVGIVSLGMTYLVIRQGAFTARAVIELKIEESDSGERATLTTVDRGRPVVSTLQLVYASHETSMKGASVQISSHRQVKRIRIQLPSLSSKELKVWLHRVSREGNSESFPATLKMMRDSSAEIVQPDHGGQLVMPINGQNTSLEIILADFTG